MIHIPTFHYSWYTAQHNSVIDLEAKENINSSKIYPWDKVQS